MSVLFADGSCFRLGRWFLWISRRRFLCPFVSLTALVPTLLLFHIKLCYRAAQALLSVEFLKLFFKFFQFLLRCYELSRWPEPIEVFISNNSVWFYESLETFA